MLTNMEKSRVRSVVDVDNKSQDRRLVEGYIKSVREE